MRAQRRFRSRSFAAELVVGLACLAALAAGAVVAPAAAIAPSPSLRVGGLTLSRCDLGLARPSWCGSIHPPLDWADPASARIPIAFAWVPASATATGTVVAQEGGPGYPSTGTAVDYVDMLGPLLAHRNLLLMDQRGTGRSGALSCPTLQTVDPLAGRFAQRAAACADQLNHTYRDRHGNWMHASDLFTTANSVRDLAELITALRIDKVDYYGDSYGTYFGQSFITHFPQLVRSAVLDSAYETVGLDPWYRTTITTARAAFDKVCERALGCPAGSSWARITKLAALLRAHPVTGQTVGVDDALVTVTVDVRALVNIINDAGYDTEPYRELDAAVRAYLDDRDAAGLLRLWARDIGWDYSDYLARPSYFSDAQYMAVACTDYPQLFSMHTTPAKRATQLQAAIRRLPAKTFGPFSTREWLTTLNFTEAYTGCLDWPAPTYPADPPVTGPSALRAAHVPTLVLNGELDSLTPAPDGQRVADQLGGDYARAVVAANTVHLVALANPTRAARRWSEPSSPRRLVRSTPPAPPRSRRSARCPHSPACSPTRRPRSGERASPTAGSPRWQSPKPETRHTGMTRSSAPTTAGCAVGTSTTPTGARRRSSLERAGRSTPRSVERSPSAGSTPARSPSPAPAA